MKKTTVNQTPITEELKADTVKVFEQFGLSLESIAEYNDISELKKEVDKRYNALNKAIKAAMDELETSRTEFKGYEVEVTTTYRKGLDQTKLKADLGDLISEYQKETAVRTVNVCEAERG